MTWREFWNGSHPIYVNARHQTLHYERIAKGICALLPHRNAIILDYGCGDTLATSSVTSQCGKLYLFDAAPNVEQRLRERFANTPNITVLSPDDLAALPPASLDLIIINSVLQYLSAAEFEQLLRDCRQKLHLDGALILADIIPKDANAFDDIRALLCFAFYGGFFFAALRGLIATYFSDYRRLRTEVGLTRYSQDDVCTLLAAQHFSCERLPTNLGHNQTRMMFRARPQ